MLYNFTYHRKQSIVSQDHSSVTTSATSPHTWFYFKLASNCLQPSPTHPNTPISSGKKSFLTVPRPIFSIHDFRQLSRIELVCYRRFPSGCAPRFHHFFLYSIPFSNLQPARSTWHTWLMQRTCTTYNALDLRVHVFTALCILWPAFFTLAFVPNSKIRHISTMWCNAELSIISSILRLK